jgi:hypothetical protein
VTPNPKGNHLLIAAARRARKAQQADGRGGGQEHGRRQAGSAYRTAARQSSRGWAGTGRRGVGGGAVSWGGAGEAARPGGAGGTSVSILPR